MALEMLPGARTAAALNGQTICMSIKTQSDQA